MIDMIMPCYLVVLAGTGKQGTKYPATDRHSIATLGYAIKARPVSMQNSSMMTGGLDGIL
ncbi:hypothetical protein DLNHIDIE_03535 [Acidithiobacillus thiooxidans ATCC 19377]|uniref:Uncharacterized protein n=1 Tax=Acidithiobacillus thiooxidans ATCC 19377 TaxID=637390 RepID=A0A543PYK6_ACITH|nr:hypothetical protein DLNHIDIE_03535 [Acidithiobacillus thiooxidans ATCC 19377]